MSLLETSQCHTNQVKSLLQHLYTKESVHQDQWGRPLQEKKKKGFRSKHGVETNQYQSLPTPFSIQEFSHYRKPLLPSPTTEFAVPSNHTSSQFSASWSSSSTLPVDQVCNSWLSDFYSLSSTTTHHPKPRLFLQRPAYIRALPSTDRPSHIQAKDDMQNWNRAFDWYENQTKDDVTHEPTEEADSRPEETQRNNDEAMDWQRQGMALQEMDQDKAAIEAFRQGVTLDPKLLESWLGLAISYANEHDRAKVYECLEAWMDHNDKYQHVLKTATTDRHTALVERYLAAARCAPTMIDTDIQTILGVLFYLDNDENKARDCFQTALANRIKDPRLWNQLGSVTQPRDAIELYSSALDLNPHYIRARYNLAIVYMKLAEYGLAARHLVRALRHYGTTPSPMWSSLRLVMYMLDLDHLAEACNRYDLKPFEPFFKEEDDYTL